MFSININSSFLEMIGIDYIKYVGDKSYIVKREMSKHRFVENNQIRMDWVAGYRDYMDYDHVLQSDDKFFFCKIIIEAEIIEENE